MINWETLSPSIYLDASLTGTVYLNTVASTSHMTIALLMAWACQTKKLIRNGLRNGKSAQGMDLASKFPCYQSDQTSIRHAETSLIHGVPTSQPTGFTVICHQRPGARHQRTPSVVPVPCFVGSELFW